MAKVTTHEAKTQLSKLLVRAEQGEEIQICRGAKPVAKLVRVDARRSTGRKRPRVGEQTSEPVQWTKASFAPLGAEELAEWGL
jgi:antitoxin (DNA-binding transcriptional repressor) of toxin-antitoxin stability system